MEKCHNHCVMGNLHLYDCVGIMWLFDSVYVRSHFQDSGKVDDVMVRYGPIPSSGQWDDEYMPPNLVDDSGSFTYEEPMLVETIFNV